MSQATLSVAVTENRAFIKVHGRATFESSEDLKKFCIRMLDQNVTNIDIEMSQCSGMDSTFMGIMTMISLAAKKKKAIVSLINTGEANQKNLFSLGLKTMFNFTSTEKETQPKWEELAKSEVSQDQHKDNVLNAHQTLIDVHEDNRKEFQDIITFLKDSP
jgi:anti-sigma B factor antagonist